MYGAESPRRLGKPTRPSSRAEREKARELLEIQGEIAKGREAAALAGVDSEPSDAPRLEVEMGRMSKSLAPAARSAIRERALPDQARGAQPKA
jgi:hypothetical protein